MHRLLAMGVALFTVSALAGIPNKFGPLHFGMSAKEVSRVLGVEVLFEGRCASCPAGTQEVDFGPRQFGLLASAFPGITANTRMPPSPVTLISTNGKLSGIVYQVAQSPTQLRALLEGQLGTPVHVQPETVAWRSADIVVQADYDYGTIRVFDRRSHPYE